MFPYTRTVKITLLRLIPYNPFVKRKAKMLNFSENCAKIICSVFGLSFEWGF